jgi:hypothetical protein
MKQNIEKLWGDAPTPQERHRIVTCNSTESGNALIEYARLIGWEPKSISHVLVGIGILFERTA